MKTAKIKKAAVVLFALPLLFLLMNITSVPALAATGTVYTCTINREYRHPVSGEIEDSGGEASYATGQGMVEGCVYPDGILEVTDDGQYYLTFRMSLMDYTSNHQFWIQPGGTGDYQSASVGVTQNGTDTNGTTADICVQIPNENTVIRGTMYVEPMGRYVIWYMYPSNFSEGNQTDMVPYAVNETDDAAEENTDTAGTADNTETTDGTVAAATPAPLASGETTPTPSAASPTPTPSGATVTPGLLKSTIGDATSEGNEAVSSAEPIEQAEGLSLSTADESDADDTSSGGSASAGSTFLAVFLGILIAGGILLFVAFLLVKYILQNYYRWIGGRDDDDYDA